ncbi:MAG: threonylcarbamoyl-AMP synthase [Bacteroidales bacterium]|nr:threonylcarbamoyl-AMP synthase [Bacteroidales bacterium]
MALFLKIHPDNPSERLLRQAVEIIEKGGVIIYPTDTVYGIGCDITKSKAVERVVSIKGERYNKANFSFICHDIRQISEFTTPIDNNIFKLLRRNLPGPFTFILEANNNVQKILKTSKKTVGVRIPDNKIITEIVKMIGNPILTTSLKDHDEIVEYTTDPELIYEDYRNLVDVVIDGGYGNNIASTVVDCTGNELEIIRQGIGELIL